MLISKVPTYFERLGRHYLSAKMNYDAVSFLDLSHSLRFWTELPRILEREAPAFAAAKDFVSALPDPKLRKAVRGRNYVLAVFDNGVELFMPTELLNVPANAPKEVVENHYWAVRKRGSIFDIGRYFYVCPSVGLDALFATRGRDVRTRCTFAQYLAADAVRVAFEDKTGSTQRHTISREVLIKRVANTLDGSHPSGGERKETENMYDEAVEHLMQYRLGRIPLPFFILLKTAQDIVAVGAAHGLQRLGSNEIQGSVT